mgnify:CR=1 FL=1
MSSLTYREIKQQYEALRRTFDYMSSRRDDIVRFFRENAEKNAAFVGCGSSYCLSQSAALSLRLRAGIPSAALAGGDDVIRGEETQVIGALDIAGITDGVLCLPGTHSKWVVVEGRRIVRFATFMTGEIYGVLRAHSILGRLMTDDVHDPAAFTDGLARGHTAGGLLHQLFAVRTEGLFGRIDAKSLGSFMSGLLIGHEVRAALESMPSRHVVLVGAENLAKRYQTALAIANVGTTEVAGDVAAARGLWLVAARAGFESCLPLQAEPKPG